MATVLTQRHYTPDDLLSMPKDKLFELVDGNLVECDMSLEAAIIAGNVATAINTFVKSHGLGAVASEAATYRCFPHDAEMVRRPDVSFIQTARLRPEFMTGHVPIPPDLAVEVISPNDLAYEVDRKVGEYLRAGVRLVWVVNPSERTILISRGDGTVGKVIADGTLDGEAVIPGFRCPAADIFRPAGS